MGGCKAAWYPLASSTPGPCWVSQAFASVFSKDPSLSFSNSGAYSTCRRQTTVCCLRQPSETLRAPILQETMDSQLETTLTRSGSTRLTQPDSTAPRKACLCISLISLVLFCPTSHNQLKSWCSDLPRELTDTNRFPTAQDCIGKLTQVLCVSL